MTATARVRFAAQRQQLVLQQLAVLGRVEAGRLAKELGVSKESIRKDLAALERGGLLRRVHGGAIPVQELTFEPRVDQRTSFMAEKDAIARAALAHVPPGGSVLLDAGSTTARLAALLPADQELFVCTNALPIAMILLSRPSITVRTLGGTVRRRTLAEVGPFALDALGQINVDVAFLGSNGVSFTRGLTTPDDQEALVKNHMRRAARRRILLVDHSKFGRESLCRHAELSDIDLLITDSGVSRADLKALARAGVQVQIAGGNS
jgi:DeoR family transcriptional regulator, fructose operon transcriptional repressor